MLELLVLMTGSRWDRINRKEDADEVPAEPFGGPSPHHEMMARRNHPLDPRATDPYEAWLARHYPEWAGSWFQCTDESPCNCQARPDHEVFHRRSPARQYQHFDDCG